MISVVICSVDSGKLARASQMYRRLLSADDFEIIAIRDAQSLTEGYNRGLSQSRGELVIFSHDDVEFLAPDFRAKLVGHMAHCDVLGVGGTRRLTTPYWLLPGLPYAYGQVAYPNFENTEKYAVVIWSAPARLVPKIQAMDGIFLCARRSVAQAIGFDQETFKGFHLYDIDFTFRAFLAGHRLAVACDLYPVHASLGSLDPQWNKDARLFTEKFGPHLAPAVPWTYRGVLMLAPTPQDVIQIMTPLHWED